MCPGRLIGPGRHRSGQLLEVHIEALELDPDGVEPHVGFGLPLSQLAQDGAAVM
jgi:hypothetical protein